MKTALVTGGAGFIGSHIAQRLLALNWQVRVLDNFETGHHRNLEGLNGHLEVLEGDLCDAAALRQAVTGVELVFHEAALASVPRSIKDPVTTHRVNAEGTLSLLEASRQAGVRRFVYAGSSSAYGNAQAQLKSENLPDEPLSPYALSKCTGEGYCRIYASLYGLETVVLRYFNVFGARQDPDSPYAAVIPLFASALTKGERPVIYGDGEQTRDFTHVDNVVELNLLAAHAQGVSGETINAGCGDRITINHLAAEIAKRVGRDLKPVYQSSREGDVRHSQADIQKARRLLDYRPVTAFGDGLRRTVRWFLEEEKRRNTASCKPLKV